uniref:C-type lectin domain-containing protein n=1 Tax=Salarias fasciatus TaxID=181472 RepID=A0A672F3D4_SALFA
MQFGISLYLHSEHTHRFKVNLFILSHTSGLLYSTLLFSFAAINDHKQYILIEQNSTWEDARSYCRVNHTDLAVIEKDEENRNVTSVIRGHTVWIGLYREPWMWSDGSNSSFRRWQTIEPSNSFGIEHCAVDHLGHQWGDRACGSLYPFVCQGGKRNSPRQFSAC